jgi:hypothetical protein
MSSKIPPPSAEFVKEAPWDDDAMARFETEMDPLEAQILQREALNRLKFLKASGTIVVLAVYLFAGILAASFIVWSWHYITPWAFLTEEQLAKIQSVIFSGTLGAVVATLARGYIRQD